MPTRFLFATALGGVLLAAAAPALAAGCDGSSDPCTLDLGNVTATFAEGAASYFADAQFTQGNDGSAYAFPDFLSTLQVVNTPGRSGFSFTPQLYANVGGSGFNGVHEVVGYFDFHGVSFAAKPGYRIDGLEFKVSGNRSSVGDATAFVGVPGITVYDGDNFEATAALNPGDASVHAEFTINAVYLADEYGGAIYYGAASASFSAASFIAQVSAVPEPQTWALFGLGAAVLAARGFRRARA
jgi:hypothetical protein